MKKHLLLITIIIPLLLFMSCPENGKKEPIELELYETYCTSIELKITMMDSLKEKEYSIKRNDSVIVTGTMTENQIIITDENLEPNTQYSYKAYSKNDESEIVTTTTMDTTSHDFTWEIDTLGNYGSSINDVAIIDENNIWVVGEIVTDTTNYNAAHWNGEIWELIQIERPVGFDAVFAFNKNEIWFADGCFVYLYNGKTFTKKWECDWQTYGPGQASSIWGSSSDNMYFVGNNGSIVHYDGSNFTKLETGLEIEGDFVDIDGTADGEKVFVVIYQYWRAPHKMVVFQIEDEEIETLFYSDDNTTDYGEYKGPIAVKVIDDYAYFKIYENIWRHNWRDGKNKFTNIVDDCSGHKGMKKLAGNNHNDLFGISSKGWFMHYNGSSWISDYWLDPYDNYFKDFSVKNNLIIMVGETNNRQGLIVKGKRN